MKATRKLIPALALLLVSAVLLSTASYAWFTTNTVVTADMTVGITATTNLQISENANGPWKTGINWDDDKNLMPVSSVDAAKWAMLDGDKKLDGYIDGTNIVIAGNAVNTKDGDGLATIAPVSSNLDSYRYTKDFYILSSTDIAANKIVISVEITNTTADTLGAQDALRVAVIIGGKTYIFAQSTDTVGEGEAAKSANYAIVAKGADSFELVAEDLNVDEAEMTTGITGGAPEKVTVVVWYEGNDPDCVSYNVADANNTKVVVGFEVK